MKRKLLSVIMVLAMMLTLFPATAFAAEGDGSQVVRIQDTDTWYADATREFMTRETYWFDQVTIQPTDYSVNEADKTVSIGSPEALAWWAKQVNGGTDFSGYTVNITENLDMSDHYWTPICTGKYTEVDGQWKVVEANVLEGTTINGGGHTITGLATSTGLRGPNQDSQPGDGNNCFYDAAFIGYSCCDITISDLTFDGARMAISEPFDDVVNRYGSSMVSVVVGAQNKGSLTLNDVTVNDAKVLAMQKASAFVGNLMGNSTLTVNDCAITNSTFSAYFMVAPIAAYGTSAQVTLNGIKLENNTVQVVEQSGSNYTYDEQTGAEYWEGDLNACPTALFYDGSSTAGSGAVWAPVAEVNGYQYDTLAGAIAAAGDGDTVTLVDDCTVSSAITVDKNLTLDLNGHKVINHMTADRPFQVTADVDFIIDGTAAGSGMTIPDSNTGSYGFIKISAAATVTLNGGTYIGDTDNGSFVKAVHNDDVVDASGCTINMNDVTMTSNRRFFDTNTLDTDASTPTLQVTGGTYTTDGQAFGVDIVNLSPVTFTNVTVMAGTGPCIEVCGPAATFTDCTFTVTGTNSNGFGTTAVATSWEGTAVIDGGTYSAPNGYGVYVYNSGGTINIESGTVSGGTAAVKADSDIRNPQNGSKVTITGGNINGPIQIESGDSSNASLTVTGGYFTSDPSDYVAEDYAAVESDVDGYTYMVVTETEGAVETEVAPAAPSVTLPDDLGEADQNAAESVKTELEKTAALVTGDGLDAAALTQANTNTIGAETSVNGGNEDTTPLEMLKTATSNEDLEASAVNMVVQPYMDVVITGVSTTGEEKTLSLNITPKYNLVATTADVNNSEPIILPNNEGTTNAVVVQAGLSLTITKEVTMTIPLPTGFVSGTDSVYVQHKGYEYTATVTDNVATFTNPHGFSAFTISTTSTAEAELNGTTYTSLAEALADAQNNDTVTILKDNLSATMSGSSRTITLANNTGNQITVTINGTAYSIAANGQQEITYTAPSPSSGGTRYAVNVADSSHGTVTVSPSRASYGTMVTITVKPDAGYVLDELLVALQGTDGGSVELTDKGNGQYTFTMPRAAVTVEATFVEETADTGYSDVSASAWYADAVAYVTDNGMMQGNAGRFMPNDNLDRAMMAQILYNLEDNPAVNGGSAFGDVGSGSWYADAVAWASANSVITGYDNGNYGPNDSITREQMALMLYRYAALKGYDTTQSGAGLTGFADAESVSSWASEGMIWAVNAGVINGKDGNRLDPQGTATRAEVAQVLMNFGQNVMP